MNDQRRKAVEALKNRLDNLKLEFDAIYDALSNIQSEEEDARDAMPESLQLSERYEAAEAACDALGNAISEMENMDFNDITGYLSEAQS